MKKLNGLGNIPTDYQFNAKGDRFKKTHDMHHCDPKIKVGPTTYDISKGEEKRRHIPGPRIDYKGDFSLPFNEKNPLNYIKPITVNIYFKQTTPGVGQYDPA
jgi:hypothetical protein